jgi:hypothetical protein
MELGTFAALTSVTAPEASSTEPQAWHSPHCPTHLMLVQPHSLQRNSDLAFAIEQNYWVLATPKLWVWRS